MLHWRRKSVLRRHKLWAKLVACSFGMHLVFLVLLFVGYRDTIKFTFSMNRHREEQKRGASVTLIALQPSRSIKSSPTVVKGWRNRKLQAKQVVRKPIAKKSRTQVAQIQKKSIPKKVVQKAVQKKNAPKKVLAKAKPSFAKTSEGRPKPKPVQKKLVKNSVQKQIPQSNHKLTQSISSADLSTVALEQADAEFSVLQQELAQHWQPPVGIDKSCACEITAQINRQGKIEDINIDAPSGVLMFDVAARTAMLAMELPKWTWGKSLTITFKP